LKELNHEFGGSAKAAGQTLPGQLQRAQRSFEDIAQSIVAGLMPVLQSLMPLITGLMRFVGNNTPLVLGFAAAITELVVAFKVWNFWTNVLSASMRAMLISLATNPVFLIIAAIVALGIALVVAYKKCKTFRDIVDGVFRTVKNIVVGAINFIRNHWKLILGIL